MVIFGQAVRFITTNDVETCSKNPGGKQLVFQYVLLRTYHNSDSTIQELECDEMKKRRSYHDKTEEKNVHIRGQHAHIAAT